MATVKWLIQTSGLKIDSDVEMFFSKNCNFQTFGIIPFTAYITGLDDVYSNWLEDTKQKYILRGGTKLLSLFSPSHIDYTKTAISNSIYDQNDRVNIDLFAKAIEAGLFYNFKAFDQAEYCLRNIPLLNKDAVYLNGKDAKFLVFDELKFIKPTSDGKAFNGGLINPGQSVGTYVENTMHRSNWTDETILIATPKAIEKEWRFFVVGDQVITGSLYMERSKVTPKALSYSNVNDMDAISFAKEIAKCYQPAVIFGLDVCKQACGAWSVVEYNCFNCSGFYKSDLAVLKEAIEATLLA